MMLKSPEYHRGHVEGFVKGIAEARRVKKNTETHKIGDDPTHEVTRCCDEREDLINSLAGYKQDIRLLQAQVSDLQGVVRLLVYHTRRGLTDPEGQRELDDTCDGTPMEA